MNNHDELERTIKSLANALKRGCQVVVVDSGESPISKSQLCEWIIDTTYVLIIHSQPRGIYSAINEGIIAATGEWLIVMTAGDGLLPNAENIILSSLSDKIKILVFDQQVRDSKCRPVYTFKSTDKSLWPTQSVVIKKSVYQKLGCYDTAFVNTADQRFFWEARREFHFKMIPVVVSYFCLGGLSSTISTGLLREHFSLNRYLGKNFITCMLRVFRTIVKRLIEKTLGETLMISLKRLLFRYSK
jgi:glycosyltransferase involved in cell wall biosynthesis